MGSVISDIECPNCKSENAFEDFYYKSGEEYVFCPDCGYHHQRTLKRDSENKVIQPLSYDEVTLDKPFGSYRVKPKESIATQTGCLASQKEFEALKASFIGFEDTLEEATLSQFIEGKIVVTDLLK
jgi:Zn ribbon nucleic-acid-binding protein